MLAWTTIEVDELIEGEIVYVTCGTFQNEFGRIISKSTDRSIHLQIGDPWHNGPSWTPIANCVVIRERSDTHPNIHGNLDQYDIDDLPDIPGTYNQVTLRTAKDYKLGENIRVTAGEHEGEEGTLNRTSNNDLILKSSTFRDEITVSKTFCQVIRSTSDPYFRNKIEDIGYSVIN